MSEQAKPESLPTPPEGGPDARAPAEATPQAASPAGTSSAAGPRPDEGPGPAADGPRPGDATTAGRERATPAEAACPAAAGGGPAVPAGSPPAPAATVHPADTTRPTVVVRYGSMGLTGRFVSTLGSWRCGQRVVIKSDRGMEIGNIVCSWGGCGAPGGVAPQVKGEVIRNVTHADEVEQRHLQEGGQREFAYCKSCIASRNLPMKLVGVEHLLGGDRIIFYFVAESRVDFRALVRDLAHEFQTRIEMRQIGVRDEARLLGDYERCGRPLCCRAWIKDLEPVSMKMAKIQKATLDPAKISGRCGRLMCCLRFEHATYRDLARNLPRKNTLVQTPEGPGKVLDTDIVSQMVAVVVEGGTRIVVPVESIRLLDATQAPAAVQAEAGQGAEAPAEGPPSLAEGAPSLAERPVTAALRQDGPRDQGRPSSQGKPRDQGRSRDHGRPRDQPQPPERTMLRDQAATAPSEPAEKAGPPAPAPGAERAGGGPTEAPAGQPVEAAIGQPGQSATGQPDGGDCRGRRGRRRSRRGGRNRNRGPRGPGGEGGPTKGDVPGAGTGPPAAPGQSGPGAGPPAANQGR